MSDSASTRLIRLSDIEQDDLPRIYEFQLDPESNRLAVTYSRSIDAFEVHWKNVLSDPKVIVKGITFGDALVGHISCFKMDELDVVGYWVARDFWGKGIATYALELLLKMATARPLYARAATSNNASIRVLQKCGFVIQQIRIAPADDRYPECEEALLVLK